MNSEIMGFFRHFEWDISWSGGKDSTSTILIALENKIPIKTIKYVNMRFDDTLTSHLPEDENKIKSIINTFKMWGLNVEIIEVPSYMDMYNKILYRSKKPERNGLPYGGAISVRGMCTLTSIKQRALKSNNHTLIGIASDEFVRLRRIKYPGYSILKYFNITENDCITLCRKNNMLLPCYDHTEREGCWFCPNSSKSEIEYIKYNYLDIYYKYISKLENTPSIYMDTLKRRHNWLKYSTRVEKGVGDT